MVDVNVNVIYVKSMSSSLNTPKEQSWGIRQFADMFDVTPRTIRFYEDKGLLSPEREAGTRIFGQSERLRFEKIMRAKRMGFSLDDIKAVLDVTNGNIASHDELKRRRANFQDVIDGLDRRREDIDIMAKDMREIVSIIDDHLQNTQIEQSVESLASKYEAAFKKKFAHIEGEHGYSLDVQSDTFEPAE